jgi:predicted O-methyltransferase YrrM
MSRPMLNDVVGKSVRKLLDLHDRVTGSRAVQVPDLSEFREILPGLEDDVRALEQIVSSHTTKVEGDSFHLHETANERSTALVPKQANLFFAAKMATGHILEIGFNAGFSSLLFLSANDRVRISAVDICAHDYVVPCFEFLRDRFGGRIELIRGDSRKVLPELCSNRENRLFSLVHVDGFHLGMTPILDLANALRLADDQAIVIFDDTQLTSLSLVWRLFVMLGFIRPVRGFHRTSLYQHKLGLVQRSGLRL